MKAGVLTALVVAGLLCALVPAAAQAEQLRGQTSQKDKRITIRTNAGGKPTKIEIIWRAPCRYGGRLEDFTRFFGRFDEANAKAFQDSGSNAVYFEDVDLKARFSATIKGRATGDGGFGGTFRLTAKLTRDGDYFSTCRTGRVTWTATPR